MSGVDIIAATPVSELEWDAFTVPDGYRAEIIQGELVVTPGPSLDHTRVQGRLIVLFAQTAPIGWEPVPEPEWRLPRGGIVAAAPRPDVAVVAQGSSGRSLTTTPLLAVEVLSPTDDRRLSTGQTHREAKLIDYATNGLADFIEVDLTVVPTVVIRYELHAGELREMERAAGDETIEANRPFPYRIRPADL